MTLMISDPSPVHEDEDPPHTSFVHLLYAVCVMASSVAAFGLSGIVPGVLVVGFWSFVFGSRSRPKALFYACVAMLCLGIVVLLIIPAVQTAREASRRTRCKNHFRNIVLALHNYHSSCGSFPPAYIADENGRPIHSWRVLILPLLDQVQLYEAYDFDEPWDGPNNRQLISQMPDVYKCPSTGEGDYTSYVAVVGPDTCWPEFQGRKLRDIEDGSSNTILLIEWNSGEIYWTEPRDLSLDDAVDLLSSSEAQTAGGHRYEDYFYEYYAGREVAHADGRVSFLSQGVDPEIVSALLRIADGGPDSDWENIKSGTVTYQRLKIGNTLRLATFLVMMILPLPWVWLHPTLARRNLLGRPQAAAG